MSDILIVDDEPANLKLLGQILKNEETTLRFAKSGEEALQRVKEQPPDLILLDILMPTVDGYEVLRELRQQPQYRDIPVIFVTTVGEDWSESAAFALGVVDYITKPVSATIVKARVGAQLAVKKARDAQKDLNQRLEEQVKIRTRELWESRLDVAHCLALIAEYSDPQAGANIMRMSYYARLLALAVGLSEDEADLLLNAAPLHDIGKIGVPDALLLKPGKPTPEEYEIMKSHVTIGDEILSSYPSKLLQTARSIVLTHHEHWDGRGYPKGLKGEDIPLMGRIVALADVFDVLTSKRPYKEPWSVEAAMAEIKRNIGTQFDPKLVDVFETILPKIIKIKEEFEVQAC